MIRAFLTAIWLCAVTIAGTFGASQLVQNTPMQDGHAVAENRGERYIETDLTAVPVIAGNAIEGYFLLRMAYVLDDSKLVQTNIPIGLLLNDFYFGYAYNNEDINFNKLKRFDLNKFSDGLIEYINKEFGAEVVTSNLILQIDYRKVKEVRSSITEPL